MPVTNFFAHIAAIPFEGCLNITVKKDGEQLTTSVLLQNDGCGDAAKSHIPPLILKGSAKELCEGFFDAVSAPVAETSKLLVNMEQFLKGQEAAKKNAAMEKKKTEKMDKADKSDKPATPEEIKAMKYKGIMAEVDKLEAAGKYREAWLKVPKTSEFPDKSEEMQKRRSNLSAQFSPDLFGAGQSATDITNVEPKTKQDATDHTTAEGIPDEGQGQ
ncbi:prtrc system protein e [Flavobacterium sp. D11R37]|uniref:prtrc system protein e n=1 Tax=Flavobacterium coralii TaxID=2838017 RepID=UPI001CA6901F|nr:prtrc system protein e [Flavobacterium coralii]MBY8961798.1 prtrc system protein e [Flavobacterium coralii]